MGRTLFTAFAGACSGLLAWLLMEPSAPTNFYDPKWEGWTIAFSLLVGGLIAGVLGGVYGWHRGSRQHMLVGLFGGAFAGALLGVIGVRVGGGIAAIVFPGFDQGRGLVGIFGRIVQIGVLGASVGLAVGIPSKSWKQALLGLTGGGLAGVACGMVFNPISDALGPITQQLKGGNEIGIVGRGITSVVLGFAIGLFISLAKAAAKTAWLRLNLGRNEGREWVIDGVQTFIGRSEGAHVPLFGDSSIAPMHACIVRQGDQYWLQDGGTQIGTKLNGYPVQSAPLASGSQIGIGSFVLEFLLRPGSAPARAAERLGSPQAQMQPINQALPSVAHNLPATGPALVAVSGPATGQRFPLVAPIEIGREAHGLTLTGDPQASRRHAKVEPIGNSWQVTDLGSTNGTLVNGTRVTTAMLRPGDVLTIGSSQFRFE